MNFTIEFSKPEIKSSFDWQLIQEANVLNENNEIIAKAEIELITLNKHRDALKSYALIESDDEATDWELPLNLYFKGQNLSADLCKSLDITADIKKSKTHIMLEAISVVPEYRNQGVAKLMLAEIAKKYPKVQSVTALSMPMKMFVDAQDCEEQSAKTYYESLSLEKEDMSAEQVATFFEHSGFVEYNVDEALLHEPLAFQLFISTPSKLLAEIV
ncbi:GNAT family N-acetyltransferase [Thalassotalea atypica]|uniref:GNAT family N-acetyltransferase n=1 Tax=Thalassotalea atypica TaxID=2054316 RepID=UPI00257324E8|nr:GNAT family N-acetyltransferase [Thalassotalea atypica]